MSYNNQSIDFLNEIKKKLKTPIKPFNFLFWLYFVGVVMGIGGIGIWTAIPSAITESNIKIVSTNLSTYFIATLASSFADLDFSNSIQNKKTFKLLSFLVFCLSVVLFFISFTNEGFISFLFACLGTLSALFIWYLSNSDSSRFYENFDEAIVEETQKKHTNKDWDDL